MNLTAPCVDKGVADERTHRLTGLSRVSSSRLIQYDGAGYLGFVGFLLLSVLVTIEQQGPQGQRFAVMLDGMQWWHDCMTYAMARGVCYASRKPSLALICLKIINFLHY